MIAEKTVKICLSQKGPCFFYRLSQKTHIPPTTLRLRKNSCHQTGQSPSIKGPTDLLRIEKDLIEAIVLKQPIEIYSKLV